ncbi:MAG: hypothetical protein JXA68_11495 [Ignavibacteriales bacterium]|nr:hypothetical protein [Ignavibacteriales bacterium]
MKSSVILSFTFMLIFIFASCGDKEKNNDETTNDKNGVEQEVKKLNPMKINPDEPIPVLELKNAFLAWTKVKEITVVGFPNFFWDDGTIGNRVELLNSPNSDKILVECNMKTPNEEKLTKQNTVTIHGTIDRDFFGKIILKDCEYIGNNESAKRVDYIFAEEVKPDTKYFVEDFYNSFYGWIDKTVSVVGNYWGTTTSTTDYGVTIRIDLTDRTSGEKCVGCNMKGEPPASLSTSREDVIVKGIIKGEVFGNVSMEECVVVNR